EAVAAGQAGDGRALGGGGRRPLGPGPPVPRPGRRADAGRGQAGGRRAMPGRRRRRPRDIWGNNGPTPGASTRAGGPSPLLVLVGPVACKSLSAIGARAVVWLSDDRELQVALANQPRDRIGSDAIIAIVRQGGQAKVNRAALAQGGEQGSLQALAHLHTHVNRAIGGYRCRRGQAVTGSAYGDGERSAVEERRDVVVAGDQPGGDLEGEGDRTGLGDVERPLRGGIDRKRLRGDGERDDGACRIGEA